MYRQILAKIAITCCNNRSQVWWSGLAPTDFPKDVIERYAGRGMVIAGFEMDQVRIGFRSHRRFTRPLIHDPSSVYLYF
jgi:hypothetical protein